MRRLLLLLSLLLVAPVSIAHWEGEAHHHSKYFKNNVGGLTVITTRDTWCKAIGAHDGYAFSSAGDKIRFCWVLRGDKVLVKFEGNNETGMWPMEVFEDLPHDQEPDMNAMFPVNAKDI